MKKVTGILVLLILLAFGLPALFQAIETVIIPMIIVVFILGLGVLIFQRRRSW